MMRHNVTERFYGLTFVRTADQVAEAAATRESEYRQAYEKRLGELREAIGGLSIEDVLAAAAFSGLTVTPAVAKVMATARLCRSEQKLANEFGFIAALLRAEPDKTRQLTLTSSDTGLFRPYDAQRLVDMLPTDVVLGPGESVESDWDGRISPMRGVREAVVGTVAEYVATSKDRGHGIGRILGSGAPDVA